MERSMSAASMTPPGDVAANAAAEFARLLALKPLPTLAAQPDRSFDPDRDEWGDQLEED